MGDEDEVRILLLLFFDLKLASAMVRKSLKITSKQTTFC